MKKLDPPSGYLFERLDCTKHSREAFDCGEQDLNRFLKNQAAQDQSKFLSATHVLIESGTNQDTASILGFVTLVTCNIPISEWPEGVKAHTNRSTLPAILIARMGVDVQRKNQGLGKFLILAAFEYASKVNEASGCVAIVVDAKSEAKKFYLKHGFLALPQNDTRLVIPNITAQKLLETHLISN